MGSCKSGGKGSSASSNKTGYDESYSKYTKEHTETVDFIKNQLNIDLNKYRDNSNPKNPFTTARWDKDGVKVAFDKKSMSRNEINSLQRLAQSYTKQIVVEDGGGWIGYVYLRKHLK